ncbi:MAG: hypothetical protein MJZ81_03895 [Bacteroidales bacterium]|nr:hypothetical protein [Bacteroidales bacterium]
MKKILILAAVVLLALTAVAQNEQLTSVYQPNSVSHTIIRRLTPTQSVSYFEEGGKHWFALHDGQVGMIKVEIDSDYRVLDFKIYNDKIVVMCGTCQNESHGFVGWFKANGLMSRLITYHIQDNFSLSRNQWFSSLQKLQVFTREDEEISCIVCIGETNDSLCGLIELSGVFPDTSGWTVKHGVSTWRNEYFDDIILTNSYVVTTGRYFSLFEGVSLRAHYKNNIFSASGPQDIVHYLPCVAPDLFFSPLNRAVASPLIYDTIAIASAWKQGPNNDPRLDYDGLLVNIVDIPTITTATTSAGCIRTLYTSTPQVGSQTHLFDLCSDRGKQTLFLLSKNYIMNNYEHSILSIPIGGLTPIACKHTFVPDYSFVSLYPFQYGDEYIAEGYKRSDDKQLVIYRKRDPVNARCASEVADSMFDAEPIDAKMENSPLTTGTDIVTFFSLNSPLGELILSNRECQN